jgi:hypothetical protein
VMFILQNLPRVPLDLSGVNIVPIQMRNPTAMFDLTIEITEAPEGLFCRVQYATDLFELQTIEAITNGYRAILEAVVDEAAGMERDSDAVVAHRKNASR